MGSDAPDLAHMSRAATTAAHERWPIILTGAINDLHRSVGDVDAAEEDRCKEGKTITGALAALKYELLHNRRMIPLDDDDDDENEPAIAASKQELQQRGYPAWYDAPWLFAECYLYRRMSTLFAKSQHWQDYEVFAPQKLAAFQSAQSAVVELAIRDQERRQLAAVETRGGGDEHEAMRRSSPGQAEELVLGIATVRDGPGSFCRPEAVDQVGYGHPPLSEKELVAVRFLFGRWSRLR